MLFHTVLLPNFYCTIKAGYQKWGGKIYCTLLKHCTRDVKRGKKKEIKGGWKLNTWSQQTNLSDIHIYICVENQHCCNMGPAPFCSPLYLYIVFFWYTHLYNLAYACNSVLPVSNMFHVYVYYIILWLQTAHKFVGPESLFRPHPFRFL